MDTINFKIANNKTKIITENLNVFNQIRDNFSDTQKLYKYDNNRLSHTKLVDSFVITPTGTYPIGLTLEIVRYIRLNFPLMKINVDENILHMLNPIKLKEIDILTPDTEFIYRDYQKSAICCSLAKGRGVCLLPTGAGKSLVIYGLVKNIRHYTNYKTTLILVPTIQLVKQIYSDFIEYGYSEDEVQTFSGFKPELGNQNIIISNRQWLENHSKELPDIEVLIVDECHGIKASNLVKDYVRKLKTPVKFGLTGTMPEDKLDQWAVIGTFGPILIQRNITELQERKLLADLNILPICIHDRNKREFSYEDMHDARKSFYDEWEYIESYQPYQDLIIKVIQKVKGNSIVLFDHTEHGKYLYDNYVGNKEFINGEVELDTREDIRERMEKETNIVLFGNVKAVGTGINIKNIDNIIFVMTGKGVTKIIQSIGRGLRLKDGKTKANLIDIFFNYKYSEKHFQKRCLLYKEFYNIEVDINKISKIIL